MNDVYLLHDFVRYAIATLLNDVGVPDHTVPSDLLLDIGDWLLEYGPKTDEVDGCWVLDYNNAGETGKDGFPSGSRIKANSTAWQMSNAVPAGSDIFDAMNALTDSASKVALAVSLDESFVFSGVNYGDYFGIQTGTTLNVTGGYLLLV